jgi:cytochrome c oxidase assembly protein subunit 15
VLSLILVLFQGWFGSLVVSTNLLPGFVTVHMFLAFLQIAILVYLYFLIKPEAPDRDNTISNYRWYFVFLLLLLIPQLYLGTQVRTDVDQLLYAGVSRKGIIESLSIAFYIHRSSSLVFIAILIYLAYMLFHKQKWKGFTSVVFYIMLVCVVIEIIGGIIMSYLHLPAWVQPLHLLVASILFGANIWLVLRSFKMTSV